jgi:hypothetical protein
MGEAFEEELGLGVQGDVGDPPAHPAHHMGMRGLGEDRQAARISREAPGDDLGGRPAT